VVNLAEAHLHSVIRGYGWVMSQAEFLYNVSPPGADLGEIKRELMREWWQKDSGYSLVLRKRKDRRR